MPAPLIISIPTPCTQSWDEMTPDGRGRHCASCQKTVIDFTGYSDAELYRFFAKKENAHSCGRYRASQLNRPINIPHQPHSRLYRMVIACGLTLLFAQGANTVYAQQVRPPMAVSNIVAKSVNDKISEGGSGSGSIKGTVLDNTKQPLPSAVVIVSQDGIVKGGGPTDFDGNYEIKPLEAGRYTIRITYIGIDTIVDNNVYVLENEKTTKNFITSSSHCLTGEYYIRVFDHPIIDIDDPTKTHLSHKDISKLPVR